MTTRPGKPGILVRGTPERSTTTKITLSVPTELFDRFRSQVDGAYAHAIGALMQEAIERLEREQQQMLVVPRYD